MKKGIAVATILTFLAFPCLVGPAHAQEPTLAGRTITGTVFFIGGRTSGRSQPFRLIINRFSTPEEIQQLNTAIGSGQNDLLSALSRQNAGRITIGTGVGYQANAIIATQEGGRSKLVVLYQRNMRFAELRFGARSTDYPFGYAELFVTEGQSGEGMLIPAARIRLRNGTWEVEDFGTFPARLMGLRVRGGGGGAGR